MMLVSGDEMRWLVKADGTRVLQIRRTIHDGIVLSLEWLDIPEVKEEDAPEKR